MEYDELYQLKSRVLVEAPSRGHAPPLKQTVAFRALPLSKRTLRGLEDSKPVHFTTMTDIQNACIPHALAGRDILGAAKTGSGKTLAYIIPVLESLYRNSVSSTDGPTAIILSPTRELAVQIYQVLKQVGKYHTFSVGLLIGGKKDFLEEQQHVASTNILIATPGRLLQHLEQTPYFDVSNLLMLVLDEADRILDMGFREQLVNLVAYLPSGRQTLLFSATQTRDVSHLATLSLSKPEYLGVHDKEETSTPVSLQQTYIVVPLEHKLNAVYSFVKTHLRCKVIIFMSTCAQVRFAWDLFCSLRPGLPVMALHGKLVQSKRTQIYFDFLKKPFAVLFATDVAARGLDFPDVDWVVQADAPEDRSMYIHRAGRTARYRKGGKSLLLLTPCEEKNGFVAHVCGSGKSTIPLKKASINPSKTVYVSQRAASLVAASKDLNSLAKKAFKSYVRSTHLMPLKDIFRVGDLPMEEFAKSLGLGVVPNARFIQQCDDRGDRRDKKNVNRKLQKLKDQIKAEKMARRVESYSNNRLSVQPRDDSVELLVPKQNADDPVNDEVSALPDVNIHQVSNRKRSRAAAEGSNKHVKFDDDGKPVVPRPITNLKEVEAPTREQLEQDANSYLERVRNRLSVNFGQDKADAKERVREKRKKRKRRDHPDQEEVYSSIPLSGEISTDSKWLDSESESSLSETADFQDQEELALKIIRS